MTMNSNNNQPKRALNFSPKGMQLIELYTDMATKGYKRTDATHVKDAFSDFELRVYRQQIKEVLKQHQIKTILDYGCGGSNWNHSRFDESGESATEYFGLDKANHYEPARGIDEREESDCVISFDVLEHVFISDIPTVLQDMFSHARKLLILNIACYPAAAKLPNGENAHITVRDPIWWKGMVDSIAINYPHVSIWLIGSTGWRQSAAFPIWSAQSWQESDTFAINN